MLLFCVFGIQVAWHKSNRGHELIWIGTKFLVAYSMLKLHLMLPEKKALEISDECSAVVAVAMVGLRRLRSLAGVLSWAAGVLPRIRWAVTVLYAVVCDAEKDVGSGAEERRRLGPKRRWDLQPRSQL